MYRYLRPLLFHLDPERVHGGTLRLMQVLGAMPPLAALARSFYEASSEPVELFGLQFPNRVGLAAGYDKDGLAWQGLAALGFGHIEIGTVTPRPQPGNPKPRVFRLAEDQALINRMGFPGRGADFVAKRLPGKGQPGLILGVNLGINRDTPIEDAAEDYKKLMLQFNPLADYLTINISSPNTAQLRTLQGQAQLSSLLKELSPLRVKPLLIKLAPDLDDTQLDQVLAAILEHKVDGIIATNTTLARPELRSPRSEETGGLSGSPLTKQARHMVGKIYTRTAGKLPIIAAGGIMSKQDADAAINAGASLVQIYTGLIYRGPALVKEIAKAE